MAFINNIYSSIYSVSSVGPTLLLELLKTSKNLTQIVGNNKNTFDHSPVIPRMRIHYILTLNCRDVPLHVAGGQRGNISLKYTKYWFQSNLQNCYLDYELSLSRIN